MPIPLSSELFEAARLAALYRFEILDTPAEQGYDDIVELAKQICRTPVALVSLVTGERQWFKAKSGFDACETPLGQSVCAHAVAERAMLIIPDLTEDARTRDNTLVTEAPHIRFYAGAPLETSDGFILGTLCVIDDVPRREGLTPGETTALAALARQVVGRLELRQSLIERAAEARRYLTVFNAINAGFCTIRLQFDASGNACDYEFLELNKAFEEHAGIKAGRGDRIRDIVPDIEQHWFDLYGGVALTGEPLEFENASDALGRWFDVYAFRVGLPEAREVGILFTDITARRRREAAMREAEERLAERQIFLNQELSHRLKNSFSMVLAIARQTLGRAEDSKAVAGFMQRVMAFGSAHDILLQQDWSGAPLRSTIESVLNLHGDLNRFLVAGPEIDLGAKAVLSLSLLLHELTTNAVKHGALSSDNGHILLTWRIDEGSPPAFQLTWEERGGPPAVAPERLGFGSRLIGMGLVGTGDVVLDYTEAGLTAKFRASLDRLVEH